MNKILIIGQAPAAVTQGVPYDTTMLYDWLEAVDISKETAQVMFEFEAVYDKFPGFDPQGGHLKPSITQMEQYWKDTLELKVQLVDKVWVLGNVAKEFIDSKPKTWSCNTDWLYTIHPSTRNYALYQKNKVAFLAKLKKFLS